MRYAPDYPEGFPPEMALYQWFAEAYHWSPQQVDELTLDQAHWFPVIKGALSEAQEVYRDTQD